MANILTHPTNGAIYFDDSAAGSTTIPALTGDAVSLNYDGSAGLNITSYNTTSTDRFSIDGESGRLFSVNDSLTGTIFSVNDAAGLPVIEVESTSSTDTITMGTYASNALVVAGDRVGVGTASPSSSYKLDVVGSIQASSNIHANGNISATGNFESYGSFSITTIGAATSDLDKFLVSDGGTIKYRTGAQVLSDIGALSSETVTSLALTSGSLVYTDENGTDTSISLAAYLDEDSRSIASGSLNSSTGIVTFTRDDSTTFTLDLGPLLDDTNLVTSVAGKSGVVTLVKGDVGLGNVTNESKATMFSNPSFTGDVDVAGSITTEGPDGGMVMRTWTADNDYGMIGTANMTSTEYALLTNGQHTYLSGGSSGAVHIRGGNNDTTPSIDVTTSNIEFNSIPSKGSEATALVIDGSNNVGKRELGSNAFNSTSYLPLTGGTLSGDLTLNSANPAINFNGTSDSSVDMQIYATPEGLDFKEPEDGNKIHFRILDDTGVDAPFGYKVNGTSVIAADRTLANVTANASIITAGTFADARIASASNWNTAYTHTSATNNPHSVTATQVGLGNVTNESKATMFASPSFTGTVTVSGILKDGEYHNAGSDNWKTKKYVRSVGVTGADIQDKWVHLSTVVINVAYEKARIKFNINSYDDVASGVEAIDVSYENGASSQEYHILDWYSTDSNAVLFSEVRSIRSSSSGLSNTYDLYVKMGGDWRDTFTVVAESWVTHGSSGTPITFPTSAGSSTAPTAGSDDKTATNRIWYTDNSEIYAGSNKLWHGGNDGSGSGLDADLLDGQHASAFSPTAGSTSLTTAGVLTVDQLNMRDLGDYITLYGDNGANHSISSRDSAGSIADDIRINSYGAVYINLDSNNNNTSSANFLIGRHGANTTISDWLFKVDGENGNVGIGETSPAQRLEVAGNAQVTGSNPRLVFEDTSGSTYNADWKYQDNIMKFVWGGGEKFSISSNGGLTIGQTYTESAAPSSGMIVQGNVGIGTTSPSAKLDVVGASELNGIVYVTDSNDIPLRVSSTDGNAMISISDNNSASNSANGIGVIGNALYLDTNSVERVRIDSSGNVGIGTTSPSHKLEVGLTSSVALANQPAEPLFVSNDGNSVDGRVFISVKHDAVNTASAVGAGFKMTAAAVTSGTASYDDSLIFLRSAGTSNVTVHSAPRNIQFYVDNHDTNAGSGANYNDLGDLALTIGEDTNATFAGNIVAGGAVYPATNAAASLGLSNKQWAGLDLSSSSAITWGNGDAEIIEGETNNYSLTFKTYDGSSNSAALRLDGDNTATFTGSIIVSGTVDGRDVAADGTKLDGISAGANNYSHPTHAGDDISIDTGALTGATVISDLDFNITTNTLGHVTDANGTVSTRTLTAANLGISAPNAPTSVSASIVGETIDLTFNASSTSNIDAYLVYSSVDGSDYGLIQIIPPDDFSATMSVIDSAFTVTGTQAYRVYAMKYGILSSAGTASVSYTVSSAEPTDMSVVNLNNAYFVQWNPPSANERFVSAYNVYKHEAATSGSLSRSSASLIYSGLNTNFMYQISGNNNSNYHQFWVETTIA